MKFCVYDVTTGRLNTSPPKKHKQTKTTQILFETTDLLPENSRLEDD